MGNLMFAVVLCTVLCFATLKASPVNSPSTCNAYRFYSEAALPCFTTWAAQQQQEPSRPSTNLETFIDKVLTLAGQNKDEIDQELSQFGFSLSQLADLAITVQPYLAYAIADIIDGFELTSRDLGKLGLNGNLADSKNALERFYLDYYEHSCEQQPLSTLFQCMRNWLNSNCEKQNICFITDVLDKFSGFYCSDDGNILPHLKDVLKAALGKTFTPFLKNIGVKKDDDSPIVFSFEPSSTFLMSAGVVTESCLSESTALTNMTQSAASYLNPLRETSLGDDIETLIRTSETAIDCQQKAWNVQMPSLYSMDLLCDMAVMLARFGIKMDIGIALCPNIDSTLRQRLTEVPDHDCKTDGSKPDTVPESGNKPQPDTGHGSTPRTGQKPVPSLPNIPAIPSLPNIPARPNLPNIPAIPSLPNIPAIPTPKFGPGPHYSIDNTKFDRVDVIRKLDQKANGSTSTTIMSTALILTLLALTKLF